MQNWYTSSLLAGPQCSISVPMVTEKAGKLLKILNFHMTFILRISYFSTVCHFSNSQASKCAATRVIQLFSYFINPLTDSGLVLLFTRCTSDLSTELILLDLLNNWLLLLLENYSCSIYDQDVSFVQM